MAETTYRLHTWQSSAAAPLFEAVADAVGVSRHKARLAVSAGLVSVAGEVVREPMTEIAPAVAVQADLRQGIPKHSHAHKGNVGKQRRAGKANLSVLHIDRDLVVVDKPCGMTSAPMERGHRGTVLDHLRKWLRAHDEDDRYLGVVHRLDQETSGCLVVARTRDAQRHLQEQFAQHTAGRQYRALLVGNPERNEDTLTGKIGRGRDGRRAVVRDAQPGKSAETSFSVAERWQVGSEVVCTLATGRTHQIRVHMTHIGCPVIGDPVYLRSTAPIWARKAPRMFLHAEQLTLAHPYAGRPLTVTAPLPPAFTQMRAKLAKLKPEEPKESSET